MLDFGLARAESTAGRESAGADDKSAKPAGRSRNAALHEPGAGPRPDDRQANRHLVVWRRLYEMWPGVRHSRARRRRTPLRPCSPRTGLACAARHHTRLNPDAAAAVPREGSPTAASRHRRRADRARCRCRVRFTSARKRACEDRAHARKDRTGCDALRWRRGRRADGTGLRGSRLDAPPAAPCAVQMTALLPPGVSVTRGPGKLLSLALSPDGGTLVIAGTDQRPTAVSANARSAGGDTSRWNRGGPERHSSRPTARGLDSSRIGA